ncbi:MAG: hypothetical protein AB1896_03965 [Thermodesulfobacteriota bacterium]
MKTPTQEQRRRLRLLLSAAYRRREETGVELEGLGPEKIMYRIRCLGVRYHRVSYWDLFEAWVWRLAPLAGTLALLLGLIASQMDQGAGYDLANLLVEDPVDYSLYAFYSR